MRNFAATTVAERVQKREEGTQYAWLWAAIARYPDGLVEARSRLEWGTTKGGPHEADGWHETRGRGRHVAEAIAEISPDVLAWDDVGRFTLADRRAFLRDLRYAAEDATTRPEGHHDGASVEIRRPE